MAMDEATSSFHLCCTAKFKQHLKTTDTVNAKMEETRDSVMKSEYDIFLSHSSAQKNFVEQLFIDLERIKYFLFFDKSPDSLPKGKSFPDLIFKAAQQCQMGVVILSEEYFTQSKWPMLELAALVKSKVDILPVFYGLSRDECRNKANHARWKSVWQNWENHSNSSKEIDIEEWIKALEVFGPMNGINHADSEGDVECRQKIIAAVCHSVRPKMMWDDSHVQGKSRLIKLIEENIGQPQSLSKSRFCTIGIYGIGGIGKTTLCKIACNQLFGRFCGKVCHGELANGNETELLQAVLQKLSTTSYEHLTRLHKDQYRTHLKDDVRKQNVFLALDNVSHSVKSIEEASKYLDMDFTQDSIVMVTSRSLDVLKCLHLDEGSCFEMPELEEEDAKALLLFYFDSKFEPKIENEQAIKYCIEKCRFQKGENKGVHYVPLALKVLGVQLRVVGRDPLKWVEWVDTLKGVEGFNQFEEEEHPIFSILRRNYDTLSVVDQALFMDVALFNPEVDNPRELNMNHFGLGKMNIFEWLKHVHRCANVTTIKKRLQGLRSKSLLEDFGDGFSRISIHDLYRDFAMMETRAGECFASRRWVYESDYPYDLEMTPSGRCWENLERICVHGNNGLRSMKGMNFHYFANVVVLKLVNLSEVDEDLDLRGLKCLRSLEVTKSIKLRNVVGLGSLTNLNWLRWTEIGHEVLDIEDLRCLTKLQYLELTREYQSMWYYGSCIPVPVVGQCLDIRDIILRAFKNIEMPPDFSRMRSIRHIDFSGCLEIVEIPDMGNLTMLEELKVQGCWQLRRLPGLSSLVALRILSARGCGELVELPCMSKLTNIHVLDFRDCRKLQSLPGLGCLVELRSMAISDCTGFVKLPDMSELLKLKVLHIDNCNRLERLPGLDCLVALEYLNARGCGEIVEFPDMSKLTKLEKLIISRCCKLKRLPGFSCMVALKELFASDCVDLVELPDMSRLTKLEELDIENCSKLKRLPGLDCLLGLHTLKVAGCTELGVLDIGRWCLRRACANFWFEEIFRSFFN